LNSKHIINKNQWLDFFSLHRNNTWRKKEKNLPKRKARLTIARRTIAGSISSIMFKIAYARMFEFPFIIIRQKTKKVAKNQTKVFCASHLGRHPNDFVARCE